MMKYQKVSTKKGKGQEKRFNTFVDLHHIIQPSIHWKKWSLDVTLIQFFPRSQQESNTWSFSGPIPRHLGCTHTWQIIGALYDIQKADMCHLDPSGFWCWGVKKAQFLQNWKIQESRWFVWVRVQDPDSSPPRLHGYWPPTHGHHGHGIQSNHVCCHLELFTSW